MWFIAIPNSFVWKSDTSKSIGLSAVSPWNLLFVGISYSQGGFNPSEKYESQLGWLFTIWKNKTCSKPPARIGRISHHISIVFLGTFSVAKAPLAACWRLPTHPEKPGVQMPTQRNKLNRTTPSVSWSTLNTPSGKLIGKSTRNGDLIGIMLGNHAWKSFPYIPSGKRG